MKFKLRDGNEIALPTEEKAAVNYLADMFHNSGRTPDGEGTVDWGDVWPSLLPRHKDAIGSSEIRPLLQSSLEVIIREPVEPLMVISGMFQRVQAKGLNTQVLAGAVGAVTAGDIPEHGTYPEVMWDLGGALQTVTIGKSGLACSFTDEALRYSTWDIMGINMRRIREALLRHREVKASAYLRQMGTELYNNASPATSMFGVCTGRGLDGNGNASMSVDDLFKGMAHMAEEGFPVTHMLLNPLFFYMWLQDQTLRNMMLAHGGGQYFSKWQGEAGPRDPWGNGAMGGMGPSAGNKIQAANSPSGGAATGVAGREHGMTAYSEVPGFFPWRFQIEVSPLVPFDADAQTGDIFLVSGGNVGMLLEDEELTEVSWRDENVDVMKVKLRERYALAVLNEGQAVGVYKSVKLARNWFDSSVQFQGVTISSEISPTASVL